MTIHRLPTASDPVTLAEPNWATLITDALQVERAHAVWRTVTDEMRIAGTLAEVNGEAVRRYVVAAVVYDEAAKHVLEDGPVIPRRKGQLPAWSLWWSALKDADGLMASAEGELGLSPRRRSAATAAKRRKSAGAADSYLLGAKKA